MKLYIFTYTPFSTIITKKKTMNFIQATFLQYKIIKKMLIYMNVPFLPM